ncbi:MOSC domain-containing protein [Conexibacter sp. JD483]|uniref:MOSC domain-containing protein n=1 Tax=unclassified Conexibacter TaxID=2627773 RepID=UPI00271C4D62|nr:MULTISPECIES: MOSC domain-containing protein [unclassified Conexibacter]MDO8185535.1 MOSC domain-containing protein [Conexibacter sp. CPCC 205706]MDO8197278.1 MOSC domain-containing protein [Conexibacter sp. CPCC 205762]MDR9370774.1 MOSC domain-containing protein [Conexibacter sp. JD483]
MTGTLLSVNVGQPEPIGFRKGQPVGSAIRKRPVAGRVRVAGINVAGDRQADLLVHGGPDKAVYAYAREDGDWWASELHREIPPGELFGENLTTRGIDCTNAVIGERWRVGSTLLEVCQPRVPCYKLGLRFDDPKMLKRFALASRPGAYLRIVEEGEIGAGDAIELLDRPGHGVTIRMVADALLLDETLLPELLPATQLPAPLHAWIEQRAE